MIGIISGFVMMWFLVNVLIAAKVIISLIILMYVGVIGTLRLHWPSRVSRPRWILPIDLALLWLL